MDFKLQPAWVLHARAYRESSLLVEAHIRDHGRIGLVARGARGSRSRWKGLLQPFRPLLLSWRQRGELGTLTDAEQIAPLPPLQGESLFCALYVNELLLRALQRNDPHPDLFDVYRELLEELCGGAGPERPLRRFEKRLLEALGLALQLDHEYGSGSVIEPSAWYRYLPARGPVRQPPPPEDAPATERLVTGAALVALRDDRIEPAHLGELKWLMRRVLHYHLGDKPLKSQSLFS